MCTRAAGFAKIRLEYVIAPAVGVTSNVQGEKDGSDVIQFPKPVDLTFRALMHMESMLLRRGFTLPFGGSVLAVVVK